VCFAGCVRWPADSRLLGCCRGRSRGRGCRL
jgi:hypothetical protein